jgi:DNA-binding NarL/FixJ family response regulator
MQVPAQRQESCCYAIHGRRVRRGAGHGCLAVLREAEARLAADADRTAATELLRAAHREAQALGARPLVAEVEALARRARIALGGPPAAETSAEAAAETDLTAREVEVLSLVADGLTNREIGSKLFISEKTVSVHVSRILAKLGAANRAHAATLAHRLGIRTAGRRA